LLPEWFESGRKVTEASRALFPDSCLPKQLGAAFHEKTVLFDFVANLSLCSAFGLVFNLGKESPSRTREEQRNCKELIQLDSKEIQEIIVELAKLPAPGSKEAKGLAVAYETIRVKRVNGRWTVQDLLSIPAMKRG
jgi:hypothetical protein